MQGDRRMVVGRRRGKETHPGKPTVTYPCWVRLGTVLERQNPHSGKTKETLESRYLAGPGQPERTGVAPQPGVDVERLDDEEVKEAYRYAFRDFKTWNRTINYYRATTSSKTQV